MKLKYLSPLFALGLAACSTLLPGAPPAAPTPDLTGPTAATPSRLAQPGATATLFPTPPPTSTFAPTSMPVGALGLEGKLLFTQASEGLWQIDLATGEQTQLWQLPEQGYLKGVAASPDGTRLAVTYAPPPEGGIQYGLTSLYLVDPDGSNLQPLLEPTVQFESYNNPVWSPDGQWLYITHYQPQYDDQGVFTSLTLNVERLAPEAGATPEVFIEGAQQLSLAADGTRLTYLRFNFETYLNALWTANGDGSEARELVPDTAFFLVEGARLSPDGTRIAFGASGELQAASASANWLADWLGVKTASAHGIPWEVWETAVEGGPLTKSTDLKTDGPWPAWSPDSQNLAALIPGGVLLLGRDAPVFLGPALGHGEVVWLP